MSNAKTQDRVTSYISGLEYARDESRKLAMQYEAEAKGALHGRTRAAPNKSEYTDAALQARYEYGFDIAILLRGKHDRS